jgi:3-oxoacyl-[acyl-carrier protein] reductase
VARVLATQGAQVALLGRDPTKLGAVGAAIRAAGGTAMEVTCDVTNRDQVNRAFTAVAEGLGDVSILVNNAQGGNLLGNVPLNELDHASVITSFETGPCGALACMQAAYPALRATSGTVVNLASSAGKEFKSSLLDPASDTEAPPSPSS